MKKQASQKFWPFNPKTTLLSSLMLFMFLFLVFLGISLKMGLPEGLSINTLLLGIVIIGLLPIGLAILDRIMEGGGAIAYGDLKIDFAKVKSTQQSEFIIPSNIGVKGVPVSDSDTPNIMDILSQSTSNSIAIIDLEDGKAWWETRLLVLLAGAQRLGRPDKIVFLATKAGLDHTFVGWGKSEQLLESLLKSNMAYQRAYYLAKAIANQWRLVELPPLDANKNIIHPAPQNWMQNDAIQKGWMAVNNSSGLPNILFEEQVLQDELGREFEKKEGGKCITLVRLQELFDPVLVIKHLDQNWPFPEQISSVLSHTSEWIATTIDEKYNGMMERTAVYNEFFKNVFEIENA